jgi:hypothetical protein
MAQELFNALAEDRGLPVRAESTGTAALVGAPCLTYDRLEVQTILVLAPQLDVMVLEQAP